MQTLTKTSEYCVGLNVSEGLGKNNLTKVVIIYPRFIIKNNAKFPICLREDVSNNLFIIKPVKRVSLSLFNNSAKPQLVISFVSLVGKWWSKTFQIQDVGKVYVRVEDPLNSETLVHVEILLQGPSIFIELNVNADKWPFSIRNKSSCVLDFGQTRRDQGQSSSKPLPPVLLRDVHMLEVGQLEAMRTQKKGHKLAFDVVVAGEAQLLVISDYNKATSVWKVAKKNEPNTQLQSSDTVSSIMDSGFEATTITPITSLAASINLEGIGISIPQDTETPPTLQINSHVVKDDKHGVVYINTFDSCNPLYFLLNAVTMAIGTISGAPSTLNQLKVENARMSQGQLMTRLVQHYQNKGLSQLYCVFASADFLGNPAGLLNSVSSGVQDLLYEPLNGAVLHGTSELGFGIVHGAASLIKKSAFGATDSVSKINSSISKGLSAAVLDSNWAHERQRRQFLNRNNVNGLATEILTQRGLDQ
ncbi:hypothetical protein O181_039136 [Austropuccinia psidii MF-1]|uniref:Vacuolar protein sorting-associated protein 13 VPS13 adaptor binding domain-containing protein n=1 Tax=Austropuccinia psidii MF-1 TaxID=1389203 RepID=A0A9Q3HC95_9BASI|nr:hypothetical protein [Austropuccinia psidii MF-1]